MNLPPQKRPASHYRLGKHSIVVEENLAICHSHGTLELEEAVAFNRIAEQIFARHGRMFLLLIVHQVGGPPGPQTRKLIAEWNQERKATAVAVVSSSLLVRAAVTLVAAASSGFRQDRASLAFFPTEPAALAWIEERRAAPPVPEPES